MNRYLLFTLCFGRPIHRQMTSLCIRSLRTWGRYTGDIIVFTDGVYDSTEFDEQIVNVGKLEDPFMIMSFRSRSADFIDLERYSQIVSMDSDMVATGDIHPLFRAKGKAVYGMQEYPFNTMTAPSCGGNLFHLEERPRAARAWGVNAGFLCINTSYYRQYMQLWAQELMGKMHLRNYWADQPYFNVLVLRKAIRFKPYPQYWIDMPPLYRLFNGRFMLSPATKLLHICNSEKEKCLHYMNAVAEMLENGSSRSEIEHLLRQS